MIRRVGLWLATICILIASCNKEVNKDLSQGKGLLIARTGSSAGIYDDQGRYVILRGVNLNVLGDYWQANPSVPATAPYQPDHFRVMASYGFNCVRLLFHWSKLEPEPGKYNQAYIRQICQALEDAGKWGIYVLLDLHQDAYSKYIATPRNEVCEQPNNGWDGAPEWATLTDGQSTCKKDGYRESAPAVYHSWQNFWDNKNGIQDHLIGAWAELVRNTARYTHVAGYDLMNEPSLGYSSLQDQQKKFSRFYTKLIKAIRNAELQTGSPQHIIFFEPSITFAGSALPTIPGSDFTNDDNIVFAPHHYFEVIGPPILTIEQGYDLYARLAKAFSTTFFIGEWGVFGNPEEDIAKLKRFAVMEDQYLVGSTWWQWCQAPGDPHSISWDGLSYPPLSLHLVEVAADGTYTGKMNDLYLRVLGRARPVAIHGKPLHLATDPDNGTLQFRAKANRAGMTELWIPDFFGRPQISGDNITLTEFKTVEGGFRAYLEVEGEYEIRVNY